MHDVTKKKTPGGGWLGPECPHSSPQPHTWAPVFPSPDPSFGWVIVSRCACGRSQEATAPEEGRRRQHLWLDIRKVWQEGTDMEWLMFNREWLCKLSPKRWPPSQAGRTGFGPSGPTSHVEGEETNA